MDRETLPRVLREEAASQRAQSDEFRALVAAGTVPSDTGATIVLVHHLLALALDALAVRIEENGVVATEHVRKLNPMGDFVYGRAETLEREFSSLITRIHREARDTDASSVEGSIYFADGAHGISIRVCVEDL